MSDEMNKDQALHVFAKALGLCMSFVEDAAKDSTDAEMRNIAGKIMQQDAFKSAKTFFQQLADRAE
jgi:hypothetical protein